MKALALKDGLYVLALRLAAENPALAKKVAAWKVSPSQLKKFRECKRKWGFSYIHGIREPTKPAAFLGTCIHELLEEYYTKGTMEGGENCAKLEPERRRRVQRVAEAAIPYYPDRQHPIRVEAEILFPYGGITWRGYVDLLHQGRIWEHGDVDIVANDHKSTRDVTADWVKTERTLRDDEQFLIYTMAALLEYPQAQTVGGQWTYLQTQGKPEVRPVRITATRAEVTAGMDSLVETGREILEVLSTVASANDLPPSYDACSNFGGCHYAESGHCNIDRKQRLYQLLGTGPEQGQEQAMPTLQEMMDKKRAAVAGASPKPPVVAAVPDPPANTEPAEPEPRSVNAPEAPTDPVTQRQISMGIGETDNADDAHAVALAGAQGAADGTTEAAVTDEVQRARAVKESREAPTQAQVLALLAAGVSRFVKKAKLGSPEEPFCGTRLLGTMKKAGLVELEKDGDVHVVGITTAGCRQHAQNLEPMEEIQPEPEPGGPVSVGVTLDNFAAQTPREVWMELAGLTQGDVDKTEKLYEAYAKRFVG